MTKKPQTSKDAAEKVVKNIRRKTRQTYSAEEKDPHCFGWAARRGKHLYAVQSQKPREGLLRLSIVCILFIIFG